MGAVYSSTALSRGKSLPFSHDVTFRQLSKTGEQGVCAGSRFFTPMRNWRPLVTMKGYGIQFIVWVRVPVAGPAVVVLRR